MNGEELRALQAPLKARYKSDPASARFTMSARGRLDPANVTCRIETARTGVPAGLHPMAGGDGSWNCSGDMLLEALVACAGVTLCAVATALGVTLRGGTVIAEGDADARGTLGIDRQVPVGFLDIRLRFELDTDAAPDQIDTLIALTERYCVIYQTLRNPPNVAIEKVTTGGAAG